MKCSREIPYRHPPQEPERPAAQYPVGEGGAQGGDQQHRHQQQAKRVLPISMPPIQASGTTFG